MKMTIDRTTLEKKPLRFVVIGSGWRSLFYWRIACAYPELFTMEAMLCRTEEKAGHMRKQYGIPAVTSEAVDLSGNEALGREGISGALRDSGGAGTG